MTSPAAKRLPLCATTLAALSAIRKIAAITLLLAALALALPQASMAQTYVYVNNQSTANSVAGFSVSATGALSPVAGSPFTTGGIGSTTTCQGLDRMVINAAANLLFISNSGDQTISVFQINPTTGSLTVAPGSPYASGLTLDSCQGISLAATPDGKLLMASSNGQIHSFFVAANGILTSGPFTTNCCSPTVGMKISPSGQLLALANEVSVSLYTINADGSLTTATGSPFPRAGTGLLTAVDFTCSADRLYGSESSLAGSTITDAWLVGIGGALTQVSASPFLAAGNGSSSVVLSPDNSWLFTNDAFGNRINSFAVNADGSLAKVGSFGAIQSMHVPAGLATDASGSFLFAADDGFGVAVFKINANGSLTGVSDVAINRAGEIQSVAAYPPRSCTPGDLGVTITASPATVNAGSNVTYTITVTNNGTTAASATLVDNLPTGESFVSCKSTAGVCSLALPNPHTVTFSSLAAGASQTVTLVAATDANLLNGTTVNNTVSVANKSIVDTNPANDSATAGITISAQPGPTTLSVSPASGSYGGLAILTATLSRSSNGALISGKSVTFALNGTPVGTTTTNAVGQAILTTSVAGVPLGVYPGAITASFAGDTLFNPSTGSGSLTVNKAVLTVIASSAARLYGDPNPSAFTYAVSGFLNGDTASVVSGAATCSLAASITAATPVGRYPVNCNISGLSAANYTFTVFPGTFIINPAPLTVTADNKTRLYGDPNPAFTGTVVGLKNGDVLTPAYSTPATQLAPIGSYPIIPFISATPLSANYAISYVNGTLTVTPAPLTLNVDNASRAYGDPNPVFTGTLVGIKNNDVITATYSTPATTASPIGTYPITATLAGTNLPNYTATINNGTLTITAAALTVTAANASRLYGDPNPAFTGTIVGLKNGDAITATYSSPATLTSTVGTYPIIPALVDPTGKLPNYTVTIINGVLTINPAPLKVAVNSTNRTYGSPNPAFTGVITGLKNADPITANFTTTATVVSPVGTYPITFASFNDPAAKLANYTLVSTTDGVLTIRPAALTVTGFNGSRFYGDPNPAPTITGLKNGDLVTTAYDPTAPGPTAPAGGTFTLVPVVNPSPALSNYTVTIQNGKITINKAPLSVLANNLSRVYGSPNPALTGTITGVKNGENIIASFSTTATQTSNVGTFAITAAAVFNPTTLAANYSLTTTNGTFTITPAPLAITANNQTIILGGSVAASATYSGLVLGQTSANLSGTLSCSAQAGTGNVGSSAINCSGQSSTNYAITFTPGTATVMYQLAGVNCTNGPGHVILAPIAANGTSVFTKAATPTIAVQFRVCDVKGASISSSGVVTSFVLTSVNGVPSSTPAPQGGPFAFVGGTLANGAGSAGWQFNLSTGNLSAGNTYAYRINLNDGTSITFQFKLQ